MITYDWALAKSKLNQASIYGVPIFNNMGRTGTTGIEELQRNTMGDYSKHPLLRDYINCDTMKYYIRAKVNELNVYQHEETSKKTWLRKRQVAEWHKKHDTI